MSIIIIITTGHKYLHIYSVCLYILLIYQCVDGQNMNILTQAKFDTLERKAREMFGVS